MGQYVPGRGWGEGNTLLVPHLAAWIVMLVQGFMLLATANPSHLRELPFQGELHGGDDEDDVEEESVVDGGGSAFECGW